MLPDCEGNIGEAWVLPVPNLTYQGGYRPMDGSTYNPDAPVAACEVPDATA